VPPIWSVRAFKPLDPRSFIDKVTNISICAHVHQLAHYHRASLVTGSVAIHRWPAAVDFPCGCYGEARMLAPHISRSANWRRIAHMISDAIYQRITGEKAILIRASSSRNPGPR